MASAQSAASFSTTIHHQSLWVCTAEPFPLPFKPAFHRGPRGSFSAAGKKPAHAKICSSWPVLSMACFHMSLFITSRATSVAPVDGGHTSVGVYLR